MQKWFVFWWAVPHYEGDGVEEFNSKAEAEAWMDSHPGHRYRVIHGTEYDAVPVKHVTKMELRLPKGGR